MKIYQGSLIASSGRIAIIASRFNEFIVQKLISGAEDALLRHGFQEKQLDLYWVPGAFEIPSLASKLTNLKKYDAIICLGAVIRGATPHFDYVCAEVSKGIANISIEKNIPVLFGVLTTDDLTQAIERSGSKAGNKGFEVAMNAIEMIQLYKKIEEDFHSN